MRLLRFGLACLLAATVFTVTLASTHACPFCSEQRGPTLVDEFNQASLVVLGTFNSPRGAATVVGEEPSEFLIEEVVKPHEMLKGKKSVMLPRSIPQTKNKFLIFCDVYKGNLDPYRGEELQPDT